MRSRDRDAARGDGHNISPEHLYAVGQFVRLAPHVQLHLGQKPERVSLHMKQPDLYEIRATLPPRGSDPQYRVRSAVEAHDRMISEHEIVMTAPAEDVEEIIGRRFGRCARAAAVDRQRLIVAFVVKPPSSRTAAFLFTPPRSPLRARRE